MSIFSHLLNPFGGNNNPLSPNPMNHLPPGANPPGGFNPFNGGGGAGQRQPNGPYGGFMPSRGPGGWGYPNGEPPESQDIFGGQRQQFRDWRTAHPDSMRPIRDWRQSMGMQPNWLNQLGGYGRPSPYQPPNIGQPTPYLPPPDINRFGGGG